MTDENSFILNPESNRMVKVGGKKWRELVKKGMLDDQTPTRLYSSILHEGKDENEAIAVRNILDRTSEEGRKKIGMKKNRYPVRRGNNIYEFRNRPRQEEIADFTAKSASRTIHKHMDTLSTQLEEAYNNGDDEELGDFEYRLKNLILQEMLSSGINDKPTVGGDHHPPTKIRTNKPSKIQELQEYEEYEVEDEYTGEDYE